MNEALIVSPVTPNIGAEVEGVNLTDLKPVELNDIQQIFLKHKVLFFRKQDFDLEQLCTFSEHFGSLMKLPYIRSVDRYPHVIAVLKEADEINMGVFGGEWHSDFSFLECPPKISILYGAEIPQVGGDTLWADMAAAYRHLPSDMKVWLKDRKVVHTGAPYGVDNAPAEDEQFKGSIDITRNNPEADRETLHPAVCRHPDTGEQALFVSPTYTTRFEGMSKEESGPVLEKLYHHCIRPEFTCRFRWQENTLVVWDNRCTMHYAVNDYDGHRRLLYRTTIAGEKPLS